MEFEWNEHKKEMHLSCMLKHCHTHLISSLWWHHGYSAILQITAKCLPFWHTAFVWTVSRIRGEREWVAGGEKWCYKHAEAWWQHVSSSRSSWEKRRGVILTATVLSLVLEKEGKTHARGSSATVTNHNPANPPLTVGHRRKTLQRSGFLAVHHSLCLEPKGLLGQSSARTAPRRVLGLFTLQECCGSRETPPHGKCTALLHCLDETLTCTM